MFNGEKWLVDIMMIRFLKGGDDVLYEWRGMEFLIELDWESCGEMV